MKYSIVAAALLLAAPAMASAQAVTVYTAGPASLIEALAAGFEKATGARVEVFQATTGQVMARLEAESASPVADVLISASLDTALDFEARGQLLPHGAANAATAPDFLKGETWVTQGIAALAIAWNPASGTPRPTDWGDLTGEAFRDLVTMPDPARSGSAYELVAALSASEAYGWGLFEGLQANGMIVPGANAQAMNPVLQGAKAAVFGAVDYIAMNAADAGESIEVIIPASGTVIAPRPMMVLASAPNPDGARAFIDYVLSDEGQAMVAAENIMPARADIPADRPLIADIKVLAVDAATDRTAMRGRFGGDLIAAVVTPLLLVIVAFPLLFVGLQAIFPGVARADFSAPFTAAREALADPRLWVWTRNSAALGISVALVSALVAIPLGMLRGLCRVPLAPLWDVLFLIPFAIPPYIAALGWIMTLQPRGYLEQLLGFNFGPYLFSFPGVVFVMTLNVFPVIYFAVSRTVAAIGARYEEAARVCGARPWTAFRTVTLPLSTPAIAASLLLVFAMAIEEFGTPYALASRSGFTVLVTGIERKLSDYPIDLPGAATLSVVLMALAATAFLVQLRLVSRRDFQTVAGKPRPGAARALGPWTLPVVLAFAAVAFLGAVVPIAAVALTGSTRTISGGLAWSNFSTVHFEAIFADRAGALAALRTSLSLGIGAALVTGVIGALTAHLVVRQRSRAGRLLDLLTLLPSATPGIVVAVGLILAWTQPWLPVTPYNTVWVLLIAYCCLLLPYPVRYANAALRQIAPSLEDAARVCGAGPVTSFTRIVLPLIAPSLIAAMLLVFAIAARELVATVLLAPLGARTVALFIWRQFEQGSVGLGMAMSTLAIAITVTIPVAVAAWARRKGVGG